MNTENVKQAVRRKWKRWLTQILLAVGFLLFTGFHVLFEVVVVEETWDEYVMYAAAIDGGDVFALLMYWAIFLAFFLFAAIYMHNWVVTATGIIIGGLGFWGYAAFVCGYLIKAVPLCSWETAYFILNWLAGGFMCLCGIGYVLLYLYRLLFWRKNRTAN